MTSGAAVLNVRAAGRSTPALFLVPSVRKKVRVTHLPPK
jgi:hypothetical protein